MKRCSYPLCPMAAANTVRGRKPEALCKHHGKEMLLYLHGKRCLDSSACFRVPSHHFEGSKIALYCKQHASEGMVEIVLDTQCTHDFSARRPCVEGIDAAAYCKQHAEDSVVNTRHRHCPNSNCTNLACLNVQGCQTATYSRQDAEHGTANVRGNRCSHGSCTKAPYFNVDGSKKAVSCGTHAEAGMVNVRRKRCTHGSCMKIPSFNVAGGERAAFCEQHAENSMVDVRSKPCAHGSCTKRPSFNVEGSKTAAYCKQHAQDGMVNVRRKRLERNPSTTFASLSEMTDGAGNADAGHLTNVLNDPVNNRKTLCKVADCLRLATWGLKGRQSSHCRDHGPLVDGLAITAETERMEDDPTSSSSCSVIGGPSWDVKVECTF